MRMKKREKRHKELILRQNIPQLFSFQKFVLRRQSTATYTKSTSEFILHSLLRSPTRINRMHMPNRFSLTTYNTSHSLNLISRVLCSRKIVILYVYFLIHIQIIPSSRTWIPSSLLPGLGENEFFFLTRYLSWLSCTLHFHSGTSLWLSIHSTKRILNNFLDSSTLRISHSHLLPSHSILLLQILILMFTT